MTIALISLLNQFWGTWNKVIHNNHQPSFLVSINKLLANVKMASKYSSSSASGSMHDFFILKAYEVNIHPTRAPPVKKVIWKPPNLGWIKCNCMEPSTPPPLFWVVVEFFRNHKGIYWHLLNNLIHDVPLMQNLTGS